LGAEVCPQPFQTVDIADLGLGLNDEPAIPARGLYSRDTTRRWSERVSSAAGVVFVTPQYNWGYPAGLKNAIDHLYHEWKARPALIVTYGGHGGGKCAAQLRQVLECLEMRVAPAMPGLKLSRAQIEADDGVVDPAVDFAAFRLDLEEALRGFAALLAAPAQSASPADAPAANGAA
jgi:NAD(P)H-dependent FMN reductase